MKIKKIFKWINNYRDYFISIISILIFAQFVGWTLYDHLTNWRPKYYTNNSVDYDALRKYFPPYEFFFMTTHVILLVSFTGSFYFLYKENQFFKTLFFCSVAYMVFNAFGLTRFRWDSINKDPYNSYKTLASHFEFPLISFLMLLWVRKDIYLNWNALIIGSLYLMFFYISTMIIYYSITFTNNDNQIENLKMYQFLDFNNRIMCFPTSNLGLKIFFNTSLIIFCPISGIVVFIVFKIIYNIQLDKYLITKELPF